MRISEVSTSTATPPQGGSSLGTWIDQHPFLAQLIGLAGLVVVAILALLIVRRVALPLLSRLIKKSRFTWDDAFLDARFFRQRGATAYGAGLLSNKVSLEEFLNRFHGHNERIDVESLDLTTQLWRNVMDRLWV